MAPMKTDEMKEARQWVMDFHPGVPWDEVGALAAELHFNLLYGPYASAERTIDFVSGCRRLREIFDNLPDEVWYDPEWGGIYTTDPWCDRHNWDDEGNYVGPDQTRVLVIRELFTHRDLWRYL